MPKTNRNALAPELQSKIFTYSVGTAVGLLSIASSNAATIYVNAGNQLLADTVINNGASTFYPLDLNSDGVIDLRLRTRIDTTESTNLAHVVAPVAAGSAVGVMGAIAGAYAYAQRLAAGTLIDGSAAFLNITQAAANVASMAVGPGYINSQWAVAPNNTGYLGIKFKIGTNDHFAWIRLTVAPRSAPQPRAFTLHEWAYENVPNAGIEAGAGVPEPSSLGLLALGSLGLAAHRRRVRIAAA